MEESRSDNPGAPSRSDSGTPQRLPVCRPGARSTQRERVPRRRREQSRPWLRALKSLGIALAALVWLSLVAPAPGWAQPTRVTLKRGSFLEKEKMLHVTVGFRELFDKKLRRRLNSGFSSTVIMRVYLYEKRGKKPIAFAARTLKAVYDLWDERYRLQITDPHRVVTRELDREKAVVDRLTSLWRFPLVPLSRLEFGQQYFVAVIAEVNPMSDALLEEVRRWLRNPYSERRQSSGESFFGSFVSIFVNKRVRTAEKEFRLRTQPFFRRP